MSAVAVEGLTKRFGDFTAVDGVSLTVGAGEIFGFLGPNGAGKTTTIKMLTGLVLPTEGRGTVAGFDIMTASEEIKARIGYMSQLFSLYGDLTVEENIGFFTGLYGVPRPNRDWEAETCQVLDHIVNVITLRASQAHVEDLGVGGNGKIHGFGQGPTATQRLARVGDGVPAGFDGHQVSLRGNAENAGAIVGAGGNHPGNGGAVAVLIE